MNDKPITSAAQASKEAAKLKNVWSKESYLSLRTLIYCASLLEKLVSKGQRKQTKPSAWQRFASSQLRSGKSIQEAARLWRERKSR